MEHLDSEKIGLELKRLRTEHALTQEQIAEGLDCTVAFVSNLENNRVKLNLRVLMYYAKLCNVTIDSILNAGKKGAVFSAQSQLDSDLLHLFHQFSEADQKKILRVLRCLTD